MGSPLWGRGCFSLRSKRRLVLNLFFLGWFRVLAMSSPFEGRDCFMSQFSIVTKTLLSFLFWLVQSLRDGVTLLRSSLRCGLTHLIGTKSLSEPYSKILRDEVTLWVECGPRYTLDHERKISLVVSLSSFRMGSPFSGQVACNLIAIEGISWHEFMAAYCSPSSIVQCWDACAIYKSFRECLLKWNFHIKINFNILT